MRRYLPALAALALILPGIAHAEWNWTGWTMTADQVIAGSGGRVEVATGGPGDRVNGFDLKARGRVKQDRLDFAAEFYFDPDGKALHVVRLSPAEKDCPKLLKRLKKLYGPPPRDDSRTFPMGGGRSITMTALKWPDDGKGNFVAYTAMPAMGEMAASCFVRYRPLAEADPRMILAILQARMSSTRLPGKVLMPLAGAPLIVRQIERVARAGRIDKLVVATSDQPADDALEAAVRREGIAVFRGSLDDVQSRFIGALDTFGPAEHVVRLTADCPLADPTVIDATIAAVLAVGADYGSNTPAHRTFPKGLDVEVMRAETLRQAAVEARTPEEREHVTWALHRRPDRWRQAFHSQTAEEGEVRWTVDRPDDYAFVAAVYDALYAGNHAFTSQDVRDFVLSRPDLIDYGGDRRV